MSQLKFLETDELITVSRPPVWVAGIWECGDQRFTDVEGDRFEAVPEPEPEPVVDPAEWLIDLGPFFDRFGACKAAILASAHPIAKAVVADTTVRKWVDLQNPAVASGIDALMSVPIAGLDADLKAAILTTPVAPEDNHALRVLYFPG